MKSKIYKYILSFIFMFLITLAMPTIAFAGTSQSAGSSSSGGGGGWTGNWGVGLDFSTGLDWQTFSGSTVIRCIIDDSKEIPSELWVDNARKGAYIKIDSKRTGKTSWMRWNWWDKYVKDSPASLASYYPYGSAWKHNRGMLQDPELVSEARNSGYSYDYNNHYYSNGSQKLDAVWVEGWHESNADSVTTIVYATADGTPLMSDRSYEPAWALYDSPTTSLPYSGKSGPTEMNHSKTIEATYMTITKTETYMTNGHDKWDVVTTYSKGGKTYSSKTIKYDVNQANVAEKYYIPFDLNRNGLALDSDVKASYPSYNGTTPLLMSVDNRQNIIDGSLLKTLDTNTKLSFSVLFDNDQFGLPTAAQGGFDLLMNAPGENHKNADGTYNYSILNEIGLQGEELTGQLSANGNVLTNLNGKVSKDVYWGGALKADISANSAALTYGGTEHVGGDAFSFGKGWNGGDFLFKTTKMGNYNLSSNGRNWWEAQYEQGKFYSYGVEYQGTIHIGHISDPSIVNSNFYARLASKIVTQPVLRGAFEAKTVAGNLG